MLFAAPRRVRPRHFLDIDLGGGLHTMTYKANKIDKGLGGGGMLKVQYQLMFNDSWGLGAGVQFSSYLGSTKWDKFSNSYKGFQHEDAAGSGDYLFKIVAKGTEKQQLYALQIPIQVIYLHKINRRMSIQMAGGFTFDIPVVGKYKIQDMLVSPRGVFAETAVEYFNIGHGFVDTTFNKAGNLDFNNFNVGLQLEAGVVMSSLKVGAYLNYGILNYTKSSLITPFDVHSGNLDYISAYGTNLISAVHPLEVGLKIGYLIQMGR